MFTTSLDISQIFCLWRKSRGLQFLL